MDTHVVRGRALEVGYGLTAGPWLTGVGGYEGVDVSVDKPTSLPFDDGSFDTAVCLDTLNQLIDPMGVVEEMGRVLVGGGVVVATVPNVVYWRRRLGFGVGRWNPPADGTVERILTLPVLGQMFETAGFEIVVLGAHGGGLRPSSLVYRWCERRLPGLLGFRLHVVGRKP